MKAKNRKRRQRVIMNTVFLIMILFIVLLLGILGIMRIRRDKNLDLTMAYQEQESLDNAGEF